MCVRCPHLSRHELRTACLQWMSASCTRTSCLHHALGRFGRCVFVWQVEASGQVRLCICMHALALLELLLGSKSAIPPLPGLKRPRAEPVAVCAWSSTVAIIGNTDVGRAGGEALTSSLLAHLAVATCCILMLHHLLVSKRRPSQKGPQTQSPLRRTSTRGRPPRPGTQLLPPRSRRE